MTRTRTAKQWGEWRGDHLRGHFPVRYNYCIHFATVGNLAVKLWSSNIQSNLSVYYTDLFINPRIIILTGEILFRLTPIYGFQFSQIFVTLRCYSFYPFRYFSRNIWRRLRTNVNEHAWSIARFVDIISAALLEWIAKIVLILSWKASCMYEPSYDGYHNCRAGR